MPVRAGQSYTATVNSAYLGASQNKGTLAIYFNLETPDGIIDHALWLTGDTKDRTAETMQKCFGVTLEQLQSKSYLDNLDMELSGMKVYITTVEESYKGTPKTKVQWMNPEKKAPEGDIASRVAALFGGKHSAAPVTDDDVPF